MRKFLLPAILAVLFAAAPALADRGKVQGFVEKGGQRVVVNGATSSTQVQRSYPGASVTVYAAGTLTPATIYSNAAGTAKANPFSASSTGFYSFYTDEDDVDIAFGGSAAHTLSGIVPNIAAPTGVLIATRSPYNARGNGTTDDTASLQSFLEDCGGRDCLVPSGSYKITSSLIIDDNSVNLRGEGFATKIVSMIPTGTGAAIIIRGAFHFDLRNFEISGRTGYVNPGIKFEDNASLGRSGYGILSNLMLCPNGIGIHMQDTNTVTLDHMTYWPPTGYNGGATANANSLTHFFLADGVGAVNDITFIEPRVSNNTTYAAVAESAAIKFITTADPSQGIRIYGGSIENSGTRSIDFENVYHSIIDGLFMENTNIRILQSRWVKMNVQGGGTGTVTVGNSNVSYTCVGITVENSILGGVTIDGFAQLSGIINTHAQVTYSNASPSAIQINSRGVSSVDLRQRFGQLISLPTADVATTPYNISASAGYDLYFINVGGAASVVLPSAVTAGSGTKITVKDKSINASVNNITVTSAAGTIDAVGSKVINTNAGHLTFVSDGNNWFTR